MPKLETLDHLVLTVANIDDTIAFYTTGLGMVCDIFVVADGSKRSSLRYGSQKINLHPADRPFKPHAHLPNPGTADLCFLTNEPLSVWIEHLQSQNINILDGPIPRTGATGPIQSIYIRDPDLNLIEISTYD